MDDTVHESAFQSFLWLYNRKFLGYISKTSRQTFEEMAHNASICAHQINEIYGVDESLWFETNYFLFLLSSSREKAILYEVWTDIWKMYIGREAQLKQYIYIILMHYRACAVVDAVRLQELLSENVVVHKLLAVVGTYYIIPS